MELNEAKADTTTQETTPPMMTRVKRDIKTSQYICFMPCHRLDYFLEGRTARNNSDYFLFYFVMFTFFILVSASALSWS